MCRRQRAPIAMKGPYVEFATNKPSANYQISTTIQDHRDISQPHSKKSSGTLSCHASPEMSWTRKDRNFWGSPDNDVEIKFAKYIQIIVWTIAQKTFTINERKGTVHRSRHDTPPRVPSRGAWLARVQATRGPKA